MPHAGSSKCNTKLIQLPGEEDIEISKQKAPSFNTTNTFFCRKYLKFFLSKQSLKLISGSTCFLVFKSHFAVNSLIAKPKRVALSKI